MASPKKDRPRMSDVMARLDNIEKLITSPQDINKAARDTVSGIGSGTDFFSPGQPQRPQGPPSELRRWIDYPTGYNVRITPKDEGVEYSELRGLARYHDVTRLLIETRKDQMEALDWDIRPISDGDDDDQTVTPEQQVRVDKALKFFRKPDGVHMFGTWLRELCEDVLVIDAPTIYVNKTRVGDTRFEILDGATIRRVIDEQGRIPEPPDPAFQQIIKGLPAWNFTRDELIWMPRNPGPDRLYGFSPVEQIVLTVNIALRRQMSQLQYFTEGNIPDALIAVPKEWSPDQIIAYQNAWDSIHEGNTAERRHARFVPGEAKMMQTREIILKNEFDEWLARIACYAFSVPPTAFVKQMNRATANTAKQAAEEEGLAPLMRWAKQIMDICLQEHLGQWDLEFVWAEANDSDPEVQAAILDKKIRNGSMTINEARDVDGLDPIEGGDVPMVYMGPAPTPVKLLTNPPEPQAAAPGEKATGDTEPGGEAGSDGKVPQQDESAGGSKPTGGSEEEERASAEKGKKKTLYVSRRVKNADEILAWAKDQGFTKTLDPGDLHVTVAFSRSPVDWGEVGDHDDTLSISGGARSVEPLGDKGAVVLKFESSKLQQRWQELRDKGASWDYDSYHPHISISYDAKNVDLSKIKSYDGDIHLAEERFSKVVEDWDKTVTEREVGKSSHHPFRGHGTDVHKAKHKHYRLGRPIRLDPARAQEAQAKISEHVLSVFKKLAKSVAKQVESLVERVEKQDEPDQDLNWVEQIDISGLSLLTEGATLEELTSMVDTAARMVLAAIGVHDDGDVAAANERALDYARNRVAELVGMKWEDGELVPNPDANYAIDESTRDLLRSTIAQGLEDGVGMKGIAERIAAMPNDQGLSAFSAGRAQVIARTETMRAHNQGALIGYKQARDSGVDVLKEWFPDATACDICLENEDDGPIPVDDDFSSGDDAPPAHPNCECTLVPAFPDGGGEGEDEEDVNIDEE